MPTGLNSLACIVHEITEWLEVNGRTVGFYYSKQRNRWIATIYRINDTAIEEFFIAAGPERFPDNIALHLQLLFPHFDTLVSVSQQALTVLARQAQWIHPAEQLRLTLRDIELRANSFLGRRPEFILSFIEQEKGETVRWVSKFQETRLWGVERIDGHPVG